MQPVRRAVIDVGTNSVKLLVADVAGHDIRVNAYAFTTEMREFLGNLYKEISIENSRKLVTYRYRRAEDRQSKLVLVDLAMHRDAPAGPASLRR